MATVALAEARQFPARARHLHGQDRRRRRPARPAWWTLDASASRRTCATWPQAKKTRHRRTGAVHAGPRPPRRDDRQSAARAGCPHHADRRRRRVGRDHGRADGQRAWTSSSAPAARRRACWPPPHCAAWAARCRAACCSRTTPRCERALGMGVADPKRKYDLSARWRSGDVMFAATGVTTGRDAPRRAAVRHGGRSRIPW